MKCGKALRRWIAGSLLFFHSLSSWAIPPTDCSCTHPEPFGLGYTIELPSAGATTFKGPCAPVGMKAGTQFIDNGGSGKPKACVDPNAVNGSWATFPAACRTAITSSTVEGSAMVGGCGYDGPGVFDSNAGWKKFGNTMCCDAYYLPTGAGCTADNCKREGVDYNTACDHLWTNATFSAVALGADTNSDGYDDGVVASGFCNIPSNYSAGYGRSSCQPIASCNGPTPTPTPSPSPTPTPTPASTPTGTPALCTQSTSHPLYWIQCHWVNGGSGCDQSTGLGTSCLSVRPSCPPPISGGVFTSFTCTFQSGPPGTPPPGTPTITPTPTPTPLGTGSPTPTLGWTPPCVIGSPGCTENYGKHACDQDAFDGYLSRFNRKLTCCMRSGSRLNSADHRLDCIQNRNTDFNALWATSDADHDGGQTHAMTLVSAGSIISGFYTKDGLLCPQFSEFVAPGGILTRYKIEPTLKTIQQEHVDHASGKTQIGDPYPALRIPLQVLSSIQTQGRRNNYPSTINEMNQCPILVRAALRVECPPGSPTDAAGNIRCETAQTLSVRVRIEQLFHIAGSAPMVVVDTSLNPEQATQFNLKEIFRRTAK